jgi:hypothetical protein
MKRFILTLALGLALAFPSTYAISTDALITEIRQQYRLIHQQLPKLKVSEFDAGLLATEGVEAKAFRDLKGELKLIRTISYGEMGKLLSEYYFQNKQLVFVLVIDQRYNAPMYLDEKAAKELGIAPFDSNKTVVTEDRYYFNQDRLIRWLDNKKRSIAPTQPAFVAQGKAILQASQQLVSKAKANP